MILHISIFLISCLALYFAGKLLISSLTKIAMFLGWREFVVAFFVMAFAGSVPNLFLGFSSILHGIPELSFADVIGGNIVDLTIAVSLVTFLGKKLPAKSKMVQSSSLFTVGAALLPLLLISDGVLGREDGILLIGVFVIYVLWLFSKKERFTKVYNGRKISAVKGFKTFIKDLAKVILGLILLLLAAEGIIRTAIFLVEELKLSLGLIGILVVALGNSLPEIYFAITCARSDQNWMVLGDLMGAVIVPSTLVLGIVALIHPIKITNFAPFTIARFFLIISSLFFLYFIKTEREITKKEGSFLLLIYILFVVCQLLA
jgi:cation:H+ antiporter